jgi:hypothetical protein
VRQKLEGVQGVKGLPDEYWEYRLARHFGWTKQQIDDTPAHWTDWVLNIAEMHGG